MVGGYFFNKCCRFGKTSSRGAGLLTSSGTEDGRLSYSQIRALIVLEDGTGILLV